MRRRWLIGGVVALVLVLVAAGWYIGQNDDPELTDVVAPELQSVQGSAISVDLTTATTLCPSAPVSSVALAAPASYRGRCVMVFGRLAPSFDTYWWEGSYYRLNLIDGAGSVEIGANSARDALKGAGAGANSRVAVLGTLQGVRGGLPYVVAAKTWVTAP